MPEFFFCPECGKKGVTHRFAPNGEDHWKCRYCEFYCFSLGEYEGDVRLRNMLRQANPGREDAIWVTDLNWEGSDD